MPELTQSRLREIVRYEPETGLFIRLSSSSSEAANLVGLPTSSLTGNRKYFTVFVDGKSYKAHRLAWFYMTGEWPPRDVDHKDLDGLNNRWDNLRAASRAQNKMNTLCRKDSTSGLKGISFKQGKWRPRIQVGNRRFYVGAFETAAEAHAAYEAAAQKHFGEFARAR